MAKTQTPHIAILPSPGMGHLIPLVEFAKRFVHQHSFTATFVIPTGDSPTKAQKSALDSLPSSIDYVFLPPVDLSDLPQDAKIETVISLTVARSLSFLRDTLKSLVAKTKLVGLLDPVVLSEYRDLPEVRIPGCTPIHGKELLDPVQDRKNDAYKWVLHHAKRYRLAEGIMVNSFVDLEGGALKALQEKEPGKPPVYPVGPLVNVEPSDKADGSGCLKWLDDQPHGSVLFVSFGSGGTLSSDQLNELAMGLEMSEQRFLWVVRSPNDKVANATFFSAESQKDPFDFLPKGFLERTKGRGLVVPSWAPQAQVLSHGSTGGFLTHCGWNSTLESVVSGVPLIAWPLYAEQKMNASMLTEDIRVALRPKPDENGLICRDKIAKTVKGLMEGEEGKDVRNRMKDLKEAAAKALAENGSSTKALTEVATKWRNQTPV
ncbi:UDP-GLUCOSE-DEPENDENT GLUCOSYLTRANSFERASE 72 B1 [Hibiscus trionum]|uniref:Glycosyltransferase n=1 Tax=Hibiscus trionum TaxID=183268 RepID=A0A9W7MFB1_HIBTR|nr:UDP-GLUCOSE-DEPENDENT GLUCOSYLTRANSFERASE 72 B1 [Hibiscus trionum]